uniref:Metallothionein-like protein n=1 Tax=Kalanchoe fedtschenkoi TaxID=63787 RepID=A0A7N0UM09_KALFE
MSACGRSCSWGSSCKCNGCGCNVYPDISETAANTPSIITGLAPQVNMKSFGGAVMGLAAEDGGCKCGSNTAHVTPATAD